MRKLMFSLFILSITINLAAQKTITLTKNQLKDKIKGGWAGQTIGVTFGAPYEFQYNGTFIQDYQPLKWEDSYLKKNMTEYPGLYDDLYMDLTFVDVFEKHGLNAPVDSFANAFANAGYMLWHANQAARYNILNGIKAPQSGYWKYNPHSEDIDYQIESDYAGLMSPGMPNTASAISDKIGHIMNYGDGWYGGVYVGAMYSLSFLTNDINYIVTEALKTIPQQSDFYKCINDVINWHKKNPNDWKYNWFEIQKKWSSDIACPDGIFKPFDIDAKINAAYVVLGLLYGNGDFSKTIEIATRAGNDADCNPSSAGGILGAVLGYEKIPAYWKKGLKDVEDINFKYTTISLNKVYDIGFKHALQNIEANHGKINGEKVTIQLQSPNAVKYERGFPHIYPVEVISGDSKLNNANEYSFEFDGTGFVLSGEALKKIGVNEEYTFIADLYIDGTKAETAKLPTNQTTRRYELFWKYELPKAKHKVTVKLQNPNDNYQINYNQYIIFSDKPVTNP
jgi:hypothetical protein